MSDERRDPAAEEERARILDEPGAGDDTLDEGVFPQGGLRTDGGSELGGGGGAGESGHVRTEES